MLTDYVMGENVSEKLPTMKAPTLYSEPIFSKGVYDVFVGSREPTEYPMYVVINRDTKVVEFTHEVTAFYVDWLNHFVKEDKQAPLAQLDLGLATKN